MEVQAIIDYDQGYTRVGMGNAYTIQMLADEFLTVTQNQWRIYPLNGHRRLTDGAVVHGVTNDYDIFRAAAADHELQKLPPKILEERGRGTQIMSVEDQGKLLQYWAHYGRPLEVGVFFPTEKMKIEYWMNIGLQPVPGDEDPMTYIRIIQAR
jgi:hypothetical protein